MMRHRPYLVGAAMALFACVAIASDPAMATPCTNLQMLQLEHTTITSATDNTSGIFVVPGYQPADHHHWPSAILPGHRDPDAQFGFQHQARGLAARGRLERPVPRHRRRRVPGRDQLQRARQRHPGRLCRDQ